MISNPKIMSTVNRRNKQQSGGDYVVINNDRANTYLDFSRLLYSTIEKYYLDSQTLSDSEDIKNHFDFCFDKVCEKFLQEEINFKPNTQLRRYFFDFYLNQLYKLEKPQSKDFYERYWGKIFSVEIRHKNPTVKNSMIELYCIFDTSIKRSFEVAAKDLK